MRGDNGNRRFAKARRMDVSLSVANWKSRSSGAFLILDDAHLLFWSEPLVRSVHQRVLACLTAHVSHHMRCMMCDSCRVKFSFQTISTFFVNHL